MHQNGVNKFCHDSTYPFAYTPMFIFEEVTLLNRYMDFIAYNPWKSMVLDDYYYVAE